jgi:hypothetical protein
LRECLEYCAPYSRSSFENRIASLDLLATGLAVFIVVDAVASRHQLDHDIALRRLESAGATLTTSEAVLFEWCRSAEHEQFQAVRKLVLEDKA